jgi:glycosyltransferase involved in cell wall biosynthesis
MQQDLDARAGWLVERGHDVEIVTTRHLDYPAVLERGGVRIHFVQATRPTKQDAIWRSSSIKKFLELHEHRPFDLVISVGGGGWQYAQLRARRRDIPPVVMLMQSPILTNIEYSLRKPTPINLVWAIRAFYYLVFWNRRYGFCIDAVLVLSEWIRQLTMAEKSFRANRIYVVPNGVDITHFCPGDASKHLRQELQIRPEDKVAVWVGRFKREKGWFELLAASNKIARQIPNYKLLMVIAGLGNQRECLLREIQRLGLENAVRVVEDVPYNDLPDYYRLGHILVAPLHGPEGQPLVLIEAMACGLPVVASCIVPVADVVTSGQEGLLVPDFENPSKLATAMAQLLMNGSQRTTFSIRARERVANYFDARRSAEKTVQILETVVATAE